MSENSGLRSSSACFISASVLTFGVKLATKTMRQMAQMLAIPEQVLVAGDLTVSQGQHDRRWRAFASGTRANEEAGGASVPGSSVPSCVPCLLYWMVLYGTGTGRSTL